jgi:hypothetical protein
VVPSEELFRLLSKFPDEEIELTGKGGELRIKGKRRTAGITMEAELHLPVEVIPHPKKWSPLPERITGVLLQAARCCGRDETQPTTTVVRVTPKLVEACDNSKMFRYIMGTGFDKEALIPGSSLEQVGALAFDKVSVGEGWVSFTHLKHQISMRTMGAIYPNLDGVLELQESQKVALPSNLEDILSRAEVMQESSFDASVSVVIEDSTITLTSRKDTGWYKESKATTYSGTPLRFSVHPKLLQEIIAKKKTVLVGRSKVGGAKMKIRVKEATFVVSLEAE